MRSFIILISIVTFLFVAHVAFPQARTTSDLRFGWKFYKGQSESAFQVDFDDSNWKDVVIPHDWAVEEPFIVDGNGNTGKLPWKGEGWYRKNLNISAEHNDKRIYLLFDGIMAFPSIYINGKLVDRTEDFFNRTYSGFWNSIHINDFNNDGNADIILGNLGENSQMQAKENEPADLYFKDFDNNGSIDPIICFHILGESFPYVTRKELIAQLPKMAQKFPTFESYADATIHDIFSDQELSSAQHLQASHAKTTYFEYSQGGKYIEKPLPLEVQYAPIYTINSLDFNSDGNTDLLLCGNINNARIRFGKYDANYGLLLEGDGKGGFNTIVQHESGFKLWGDVRSTIVMANRILFGVNGGEVKAYQLNQ